MLLTAGHQQDRPCVWGITLVIKLWPFLVCSVSLQCQLQTDESLTLMPPFFKHPIARGLCNENLGQQQMCNYRQPKYFIGLSYYSCRTRRLHFARNCPEWPTPRLVFSFFGARGDSNFRLLHLLVKTSLRHLKKEDTIEMEKVLCNGGLKIQSASSQSISWPGQRLNKTFSFFSVNSSFILWKSCPNPFLKSIVYDLHSQDQIQTIIDSIYGGEFSRVWYPTFLSWPYFLICPFPLFFL